MLQLWSDQEFFIIPLNHGSDFPKPFKCPSVVNRDTKCDYFCSRAHFIIRAFNYLIGYLKKVIFIFIDLIPWNILLIRFSSLAIIKYRPKQSLFHSLDCYFPSVMNLIALLYFSYQAKTYYSVHSFYWYRILSFESLSFSTDWFLIIIIFLHSS